MKKNNIVFVILLFLLPLAVQSAPLRIIDLISLPVPADGAQLTIEWTTPEPGPGCSLTSYDVRTAQLPISNRNFSRTTQVIGEPAPGVPGQTAQMIITGLSEGTLYYVAMKTLDSCSWSSASNLTSQMTSSPAPELAVSLKWVMPTNWMDFDSNNNHTLMGVRIYTGTQSGGPYDYLPPLDVGYVIQASIPGLPDDGTVFYFTIKAYGFYNVDGSTYESVYSNEVVIP